MIPRSPAIKTSVLGLNCTQKCTRKRPVLFYSSSIPPNQTTVFISELFAFEKSFRQSGNILNLDDYFSLSIEYGINNTFANYPQASKAMYASGKNYQCNGVMCP